MMRSEQRTGQATARGAASRRGRALCVAMLSAALTMLGAGLAAAQEALCKDPNGYCTPMLAPVCVERLMGAGAIAVSGVDCGKQRSDWMQCIQSATELCSPEKKDSPIVQAGDSGCSREDARELWADLKETFFVEDLDDFAEMCDGRPQARLAANRAERIRNGVISAEREPAFDDNRPLAQWELVEAESHLQRIGASSAQPDGVWDRTDETALMSFQRDAGLPQNTQITRTALTALRTRPTPQKENRRASVTGRWNGAYGYDDGRPPVAFQLTLQDQDGVLRGRSDEPQTFGSRTSANMLFADWEGKVSEDGLLAFVKTYDGTGGQTHSIRYTGRQVGKDRIEGRWSINARTNGYFYLSR